MILRHFCILICLCASALSSTIASEDSMIPVWVVSGGRADLPCQPRPKLRDDRPVLVLWYRSSNTLPIYSYDARVGDFSSGVNWADEVAVGGRAFYSTTSNPPALVLEPAHAHDEGIYTCRIDYQVSTSTTVMVNLTVVVPPGPPVVIWDGREMVGTVGPLQENEMTELTCRSVGGRPTPILTWWNNGRQLPLLYSNSSLDPVTGTSAIEATLSVTAKRELQGGYLTCYARSPTDSHTTEAAVIHPRSASVHLNITLSPVEVRILESEAVVATSGSTIRLVCRALGSHPPAELSWWRGSKSLEPHVTHAIDDGGNITTATLTIVVTGEDDGAVMTCNGNNPALPYLPLSDTTKLVVYYEPIVELSLGKPLEAQNIKEGDDVYFECHIRANPAFHRIAWYHNGLEISQNVTAGVVISVKSLVIRSLARSHSGSYTCVATNLQGRTVSNAVHLVVRHAPICAGMGRERTQGAARGTVVTAKCAVEAEPSQGLTWSWVRRRTDGSEEIISKSDYVIEGLTSTLTVIPERREDYGRLLCRAVNGVGWQKTPCVVNLVPAGPPDSPTNCSATAINPEAQEPSLAITCLEGFDGGLPQNFLLEAWQDGFVLANMTSEFPEWVVGGIQAGKGVTLNIVGHNARGRSDPVTMEVHTSSAQPRADPDQEESVEVPPLVGAVLGVVGVILVLLLVGVALARKAQSRPRKPTENKTFASASTEGFDPDVVQSIHRRPPSLDVLPSLQDQHSKEEKDPMFTYSDERYPLDYMEGTEGKKDYASDSINGEDCLPAGTLGQMQKKGYTSSQRRCVGVEEQGLNCSNDQSDDSGVSESESDSELKVPTAEGGMKSTIYREGDGGRLYIAVATDGVKSPQTASSVAMSMESSSCGGDSGCHRPSSSAEMTTTTCSSLTELRETPDGCRQLSSKSQEESALPPSLRGISYEQTPVLGLSRRIHPGGGDMATAVASPLEVICLAVSPTSAVLNPLNVESTTQQSSGGLPQGLQRLPLEKAGLESSECPKGDQKRILNFDRSDVGVPVTLLEAGNGEILLLTRRPSDYEKSAVQMSQSPVYAITTLPKASKNRGNSEQRTQGVDSSPLKKDSQMLPPVAPKNKGLDVKHVGRREYAPQAHPDVCRRESSV